MCGAVMSAVIFFNVIILFQFKEELAGSLSLLTLLCVFPVAFNTDIRAIYIEWRDKRRAAAEAPI